ncbi:alpha/beta hydrolase [Oryzisolibacter sp. LB2S]|uniref:RBBP9/YdeN family alpha/beta hydrolase n=1 Tax=Alicycliphilus soli TaxID=3228789 RepID=UPI0034578504
MKQPSVLLLPGWQNSGPGHWQSEWERLHGDLRVQQHDWMRPLRGDWSARLEEVVADTQAPVLLAAHSLGCILVAWWAAHTRHADKVAGALLVAPGDVERPDLSAQIRGWAPVARRPLPFPSVVVGSQDDPYCSPERARALAEDWGARFVDLGRRGHINAESGLGEWTEGRALLLSLTNKD